MTIWFYPIDWSATGAWMQAWAGFAGAGTVLYAAHRGAASFDQWLKQRQTERKIVAGERILTAVYRAKDAVRAMRGIFHNGYEISAAEERLRQSYKGFDSLNSGKKNRLTTAQVIIDRSNAGAEIWKELFECLPIAKAFYGSEMDKNLREIIQARHRIIVSAETLVDLDGERHEALHDECEDDIWEGKARALKRPDRVTDIIDAAVKVAEREILPVLAPSASSSGTSTSSGDAAQK